MPKLTLLKQKRSLQVPTGTELLRIPYLDTSLLLKFGCCQGYCGVCAIQVITGEENLSPKTKQEQATLCRLQLNSHRLACQCALKDDVTLDV